MDPPRIIDELVLAASVICAVLWEEPMLAPLPPMAVILVSLVIVAACWAVPSP